MPWQHHKIDHGLIWTNYSYQMASASSCGLVLWYFIARTWPNRSFEAIPDQFQHDGTSWSITPYICIMLVPPLVMATNSSEMIVTITLGVRWCIISQASSSLCQEWESLILETRIKLWWLLYVGGSLTSKQSKIRPFIPPLFDYTYNVHGWCRLMAEWFMSNK